MCELLKTRRSVRKYRPEQVSDELLDAVLEAGLYAPSAMNNQKPVMVAVRDKATRDQLSRMNAAVMGTDRDPFYGAPCVIVVLADPGYPTWVEDGSLVLGNLLNAAHAVKLGSCWINRAREMFDTDEGKQRHDGPHPDGLRHQLRQLRRCAVQPLWRGYRHHECEVFQQRLFR